MIHEHPLRQYAGWSPRSQMHLKYLHYFDNEASENILEVSGIVTGNQEQATVLNSARTVMNQINRIAGSVLSAKWY